MVSTCLSAGETDEGINHLINAVTVCGQPQQLLQLFRSTLEDEPFQKLLEKLSSMASNPMVQQVHVSENTNSLV